MPLTSWISDGLGALGLDDTTAQALAPLLLQGALGAGLSSVAGQGAIPGALAGTMTGMIKNPALQQLMGDNPQAAQQSAPNVPLGSVPGAGGMPMNLGSLSSGMPNLQGGNGALSQATPQSALGQNPNNFSNTGLLFGALSALGQALTQNKVKTPQIYGNTPLQSVVGPNRSINPASIPAGGWQNYGAQPQQPYFQNNQANFPAGYQGLAKGGALSMRPKPPGGALMACSGGAMAQGGRPLSTAHGDHYVRGGDPGQSDTRNARLSDGEFIMDSGTTSRLGGGNSEAGARGMEAIRRAIKDDTASKGIVQKKPKSPQHYAQVGMRAARSGR